MGVRAAGDEPPAVVSLLAGRLDRDGFVATLLDLAARGWFRLSPPNVQAPPPGTPVPARGGPALLAGVWGPAVCVLPARPPAQPLAPYERRVAAHVALRAGARGEVPAPALWDGFHDGEAEFMKGFREEVAADARERGLTRPRLGGFGTRRRPTPAGQAVLERSRAAAAGGGGRAEAYAAALGLAPAAAAAFARAGKNMAWSSYRGSWRQIAIETRTWSWRRGIVVCLAITGAPVLYVCALIWMFSNGMTPLATDAAWLLPLTIIGGLVAWAAARSWFPRFVEFNGQVIRQWFVEGGDDSPDEYHVAVDDGIRDQAWDFDVGGDAYRRLPPGTFVHVRVNLRNRSSLSVDPVEPPPRLW